MKSANYGAALEPPQFIYFRRFLDSLHSIYNRKIKYKRYEEKYLQKSKLT